MLETDLVKAYMYLCWIIRKKNVYNNTYLQYLQYLHVNSSQPDRNLYWNIIEACFKNDISSPNRH